MSFKFKSPDPYLRERVETRLRNNRSGLLVVLEDRGDGMEEDDQVYPDGSRVDKHWVIPSAHLKEGKYLASFPTIDVSEIKIRRTPTGKAVLDAPNYGLKGFGSKLETSSGDAWEFDRMGEFNPLYVQAHVAMSQHRIKLESEKEWVGINPDYDTGIDFSQIVPHYPPGIAEAQKSNHIMKFDAPDLGISGCYMEIPPGKPEAGKKIFKFDEKGELNPRFLQMRRSVVRWE